VNLDTQNKISNAQSLLRNQTTTPTSKDGELRKEDFMNLFLTQLSNQNPVDPMDGGAMMTQLAQLGSMEQLQNLNGGMKALNATQSGISRMQSLNLLEKDIFIESKEVELSKGSGRPVFYDLNEDTGELKVQIESADGSPVYKENLGYVHEGKHKFIWEGKNDLGVMMPEGKYQIRFIAERADGSKADISIYNQGKVSQIDYVDGNAWVKTHNQFVPINKIKSIDNSSENIFGNAKPLPYKDGLESKKMMK